MVKNATEYFSCMSQQRLLFFKEQYERVLKDNKVAGTMSWMIPHWERGLKIVLSLLGETTITAVAPVKFTQLTIFDR